MVHAVIEGLHLHLQAQFGIVRGGLDARLDLRRYGEFPQSLLAIARALLAAFELGSRRLDRAALRLGLADLHIPSHELLEVG